MQNKRKHITYDKLNEFDSFILNISYRRPSTTMSDSFAHLHIWRVEFNKNFASNYSALLSFHLYFYLVIIIYSHKSNADEPIEYYTHKLLHLCIILFVLWYILYQTTDNCVTWKWTEKKNNIRCIDLLQFILHNRVYVYIVRYGWP